MIDYDVKTPTLLCELMQQYGSDKGGENLEKTWHNYTPVYNSLFESIRFDKLKVFELGLGTNNTQVPSNMGRDGKPGASLYAWADFFPNSQIFGADIDRDILFNTERIKTYFCDQTNQFEIKKMWNHPDLYGQFDIILEDGLHEFAANVTFFENSIHKLSKYGYFIIEDIANKEIPLFQIKIEEWKTKYTNISFDLLILPSSVNWIDNNLLVCKKLF
jgi:hypothetical protein